MGNGIIAVTRTLEAMSHCVGKNFIRTNFAMPTALRVKPSAANHLLEICRRLVLP